MQTIQQKLLNYTPTFRFTNSHTKELVGGQKQECQKYKQNKSKNHIEHPTLTGMDMGDLRYVIKKINRFDCPLTLNPQDSTFIDVGIWAYFHKRLSVSTIEKRLRYARFMQRHKMPVDFQNPSYENFRHHMDYREEIENATGNALIHEWKTMKMFLDAYGMKHWPYKPPHVPKKQRRILPFPETVKQFFHYKYSDDEYETKLYQYIFYHSFTVGWRIPSEIVEMTLDDVIIDDQGRGTITITETKKYKKRRTILPEKHILSSRSHKSFKNWIDVWRPKVANKKSGNALYLQPDGKPFTVRHLGHKLSQHGKTIWPYFRPYDMRHWCAVARLIETKIQTGHFEPITVKNWLGHEELKTTENYIQYAEMYYNQHKVSWIHHALRSHKNRRGKYDGLQCKGPTTNHGFSTTPTPIPSRNQSGPAEI